jgi:ribulose-phosphate 3-epimerase
MPQPHQTSRQSISATGIERNARIAPSILSADFGELREAVMVCQNAGAKTIHFDVMDGQFVPNITFGPRVISSLRPHFDLEFDVHLMIVQPERYIEEFIKAGADILTVHAEACVHLQRTLDHIRKNGAKAGLALNPSTPLNILEYLLDDIDLLLLLTVNPGFGGQEFIPAMRTKISESFHLLKTASHFIELEVDGGISSVNAKEMTTLGANVLVSGSAVFDDPKGAAEGFRAIHHAIQSD